MLTVEATSIVLPLLESSGEVLQTEDALNKTWLKSSLEVLSESTITQVRLSLEHLKVDDELLSRLRALAKEGELVTRSSLLVRITKYRLQLLDKSSSAVPNLNGIRLAILDCLKLSIGPLSCNRPLHV